MVKFTFWQRNMLGEDYRGQRILEITRVTHLMCRYEIKTLRTWGTCLGAQSIKQHSYDFPGGPVIKSPPCNAGDAGSITGGATKIPQAAKPLSPRATTRESMCCNIRLHGLETRLDVAKLKKKNGTASAWPQIPFPASYCYFYYQPVYYGMMFWFKSEKHILHCESRFQNTKSTQD